jgi:hypothetical protein
MRLNTRTLLLILALICFILAAVPLVSAGVSWMAIGLALLTASLLVGETRLR